MSNQRQKDKVEKQFGHAANDYATSDVHARGESLQLLLDLIQPASNWQMLDVATGAGHTAIAFAPFVKQVIAVDLTEAMLRKAGELAQRQGLGNLTTQPADAEDLPFSDSSFDMLTCRLAFHHFSDQQKALTEFARVLKPGGKFGFTDNFTVDEASAARYYNRFEQIRDPSHVEVRSSCDLENMFSRAGFRIRKTRRLSKEFEFHEWADRQRVSESNKNRLLKMMDEIPEELQGLFRPRKADQTVYFSLWEAVIIASLD